MQHLAPIGWVQYNENVPIRSRLRQCDPLRMVQNRSVVSSSQLNTKAYCRVTSRILAREREPDVMLM